MSGHSLDMKCKVTKQQSEAALAATSELLTDVQAAAFFSIEPRTLRLWRKKGLGFVRLTSKVVRYRKVDLDDFVARRRIVINM
jgi:hypothetical protein